MAKVYQRATAWRDLVEHFEYLAENAGLDTAERFLAHADRARAARGARLVGNVEHRTLGQAALKRL